MKQVIGELTPVEGNLYVDTHNKSIVIDKITKKAYIIKKEQIKRNALYQNRYLLTVLITSVFGFYFSWIWGIVAGGFVAIVLEMFYRLSFLKKLEIIEDYEIPELPAKEVYLAKLGKKDNRIKLVCCLALPVLLVLYDLSIILNSDKLTANTVILVLFSIAASVYAVYMADKIIKALKIIEKEGK